MDLENMTAKEVHEYIDKNRKSISDDECLEIGKWIGKFLQSNPPLEEKKLFGPLSYAEMISIRCDGIIRWRNSICIRCKKQKGYKDCCCEIYPKDKQYNFIPNEIWAREDAQCPYFEEES